MRLFYLPEKAVLKLQNKGGSKMQNRDVYLVAALAFMIIAVALKSMM